MSKEHRDQKQVSTLIVVGFIVMFVLAMCSGCATAVPVTAKFPEPPGTLATQSCAELQKLKDDAKLSDISRTVTVNYSSYYECAVKTDAWIEWYKIQKIIFEGVAK
jgi:hypothetical protein